jgi:adenine specific DNA methylase Mod
MTQEQKFLDALREIFVGAPVEGESGFINLMKIKSRYYEQAVFPQLLKDVDKATKPFEKSFREELFDKLYAFFSRYFSESGSIYFRHTPLDKNIYERVYTDDRDVMLFWKTHMLYYVKTDRLFKSMGVNVDGEKFWFDVSALEHKRANEKRELTYAFGTRKPDGTLSFTVAYSEKGRKTKIDDILRAVKDAGAYLDEDALTRAFRVFEKQSEVDYFINKNAKAFLKEQFDLWLYQYVFSGENAFTETRLKELQALKDVAYHIIDFIAQFEDELVRIWNKPKFVLNANYIITLEKILLGPSPRPSPLQGEGVRTSESPLPEGERDRVRGEALFQKILTHPGMTAQLDEWRTLGMVDAKFKPADILEKDLLGAPLYPQYQFLPLDTRYFKELELNLLALFDDLDQELDGWLVHSENYQALKTLLPKFRGRVKAIYIDPPYNSKSTEILYVNTYKHASWITIMENRLRLCKYFSTFDGSLVVAIDENQQEELGILLKDIFPEREIICVTVIHNKKGTQGDYFSNNNDYAYFSISPELSETNGNLIPENEWEYANLRKWGKESTRDTAKNCFYPIYVKDEKIIGFGDVCSDTFHPRWNEKGDDGTKVVYPVDSSGIERKWRYARQSVERIIHLLKISKTKDGDIQILKAKNQLQFKTTWDNPLYISGDYGTRLLTEMGIFPEEDLFAKSIHTVSDSIYAISDKEDIALDFFGGSGTTAHAVMNLNRADGGKRKYILVEMGEHFNTVILPRIKKVTFSDQWKDGKAVPPSGSPLKRGSGGGMSQFVKYYDLEQYEETLRRADYKDTDAPLFQMTDIYTSYVFLRDLKLMEAVTLDKVADRIEVRPEKLYAGIDLAETLSCVTGKWIKRITKDTVEFEDGSRASLSEPDWTILKPLIWW